MNTTPVQPTNTAPRTNTSTTRLTVVIPADGTSRRIDTTLVGEIRTSIAVSGPTSTRPACFVVVNGREDASALSWGYREFPATVDGERAARATFATLVAAAGTVQS